MPIQIVLANMELYGFGLNKEYLVELNNKVNKLMENISELGFTLSGIKFNMQSKLEWTKVRHMSKLFYLKLFSLFIFNFLIIR